MKISRFPFYPFRVFLNCNFLFISCSVSITAEPVILSMDPSSSTVAASVKPFFMCCQCRTQICLAIPYPHTDRKVDYLQGKEKNVRVADGALELYDDHRTYIEVSCPNPNCDKILGDKLISEQVGDQIVAKEGKIRVYMRNLLLREGNTIYSHHFVPIETIRDATQP